MHKEIEDLIEHSHEYACNLIKGTRELYPFGAFIDTLGQVHPLEFDTEENEIPNNGKVVEALTKYCEGEFNAEKMNAYAMIYEVSMQLEEGAKPIDAFAIDIKHKSEEAPLFYYPFTVSETGFVEFQEGFAVKR